MLCEFPLLPLTLSRPVGHPLLRFKCAPVPLAGEGMVTTGISVMRLGNSQ